MLALNPVRKSDRWCALQHKASAVQPSAALGDDDDDDDDDGSGDWDIMGSDPEAAIAPRAGHQQQYPSEAGVAAGRRSVDKAGNALNHVPVYDTGEPQYTFGDGGGPPAHSRFFAAVQDLAHAERTSAPVRLPLAAHVPETVQAPPIQHWLWIVLSV